MQVSVVLPVTVRDRIARLAVKEGLTVAGWMRCALYRELATIEAA